MKRYVVFGFDDYVGTDLTDCIQGTSDTLVGSEKMGSMMIGSHENRRDRIQILDTHSGAILEWTGAKWAIEGNAEI